MSDARREKGNFKMRLQLALVCCQSIFCIRNEIKEIFLRSRFNFLFEAKKKSRNDRDLNLGP